MVETRRSRRLLIGREQLHQESIGPGAVGLPAILGAAPTITDAEQTRPLLIGTNIGP